MSRVTELSVWRGQKVRLRTYEADDWERFWRDSFEDSEAQRNGYEVHFPPSKERAKEMVRERSMADHDTAERINLAIEAIATDKLVGSISAHSLSRRHGTFEYGLGIFREHWRKGYGSEAIILFLRYFFVELRFHKANATVYAFNEPSIALHRSLGFVEEGRIRENLYTAGAYHDELWFGMTAAEFERLHGS
jgi:RimJ/RimL family protein N-acetyltransferase